jgi:hypothetical protein
MMLPPGTSKKRSIELPNVQVSDTTEADAGDIAGFMIKN